MLTELRKWYYTARYLHDTALTATNLSFVIKHHTMKVHWNMELKVFILNLGNYRW
jgi:hypothetical protein